MANPKTPLRYPGGKQRVWPFVSELISTNEIEGGHYVEPYAGGAGIAMELLLNGMVSRVHLNDACPAVFSFWHSIINASDLMCRMIRSASMTIEEWQRQKTIYRNPKEHSRIEVGFAMFYLNRCNRSGILSGGVIGGLNQNGPWKMDARFNRNDLITRIERIASKKKCIRIRNWDAEKYLLQYVPKLPQNTLVYCDPPYFNKANRLYANHYIPEDHLRLSRTIQKKLKTHWLVSYDNADEILNHYKNRRKFTYPLQYSAARAYKGSEVFVFSDKLILPKESEIPAISTGLAKIA